MSVIAPASSATARGHRPRWPDDQRYRDGHPGEREQHHDDRVPGVRPGGGDDVTQAAGSMPADLTLARPSGNMIVFTTRAFGWPATNGPTHAATTPTAASGEAADRPLAIADREQRDGDEQGGPRGRLHRRADAEREAGQHRLALPTGRRSPRQRNATIGTSVPPTASSKAITGLAATRNGPATGVTRAALAQREPEHEQEHGTEPGTRIGEQVEVEERARQPEQRHHRQVRVVGVGIHRAREHGRVRIRRALVDQRVAGVGDHPHLGLLSSPGRQPAERHDQPANERQAEREVRGPRVPQRRARRARASP